MLLKKTIHVCPICGGDTFSNLNDFSGVSDFSNTFFKTSLIRCDKCGSNISNTEKRIETIENHSMHIIGDNLDIFIQELVQQLSDRHITIKMLREKGLL